jgi:tetratricopeptide (TPR) repeat protein
MHKAFLEAHDRAVALSGPTPQLRCNRAHAIYLFERRCAEAEAEFLSIIAEQPTLASAYVRLSMVYSTLGRLDEGLEVVRRGYEADPLWPLLPVMETAIRFWRREYDEAIARGGTLVELHPYLQVGRVFYAQALEFSGRMDEALAQYRLASLMSPDTSWLSALEGICLAKMGRPREGRAILAELEHMRSTEYVDAYFMAVLRDALGDRDQAFAELERAVDERSAWLWGFPVDPKLDDFRGDERYARLAARLLVPSPAVQR